MSNELVGDIAGLVLQAAGASPAVSDAVRRMLPGVVTFAEKALERGTDPAAELALMMDAAEEAARQYEARKFGR